MHDKLFNVLFDYTGRPRWPVIVTCWVLNFGFLFSTAVAVVYIAIKLAQ